MLFLSIAFQLSFCSIFETFRDSIVDETTNKTGIQYFQPN